MATPSILILGGYGSAGLPIARLLLRWTGTNIILAGRHESKAAVVATQLEAEFSPGRVGTIQVDAADRPTLQAALAGTQLLVVASSTARYTHEVALAALGAGVDYLDIQYSTPKLHALYKLSSNIEQEGRCFITEGGFHPGLPATLVRFAASQVDRLSQAIVACMIRMDWRQIAVSESTAEEFLDEILYYEPLIFQRGGWRTASVWTTRDFIRPDFGKPFGRKYAAPMLLEELRALPHSFPTLVETGFYITGFNWFLDYLVLPLNMLIYKYGPRFLRKPGGRLFFRGLQIFSRPPFGIVLQLEAEGRKEGQPRQFNLRLTHADGYEITAIATVACIRQYLEGDIKRPGLHLMGHIVEPARLLEDMQAMGMGIEIIHEQ